MKLETLKQLIKQINVSQTEIETWEGNIGDAIIDRVLKLINLYEQDNQQPVNSNPPPYPIPRPKLNPEYLKGFGPRNEDC